METSEGESPRKTSPKTCPQCGSREIAPIVYGMPLPETFEEAEQGKIFLGGCCVEEGLPTWACKACGHSWGKLRLTCDEDEQ